MILGMSIENFTTLHVVISLIAIVAGLIVFAGMLSSKPQRRWTALFLLTTVLTSVTGFLFPIVAFTPALVFGAISVVVLALALIALYGFELAGRWRAIYVSTALTALYLNMFVLVVQSFQKLPFLHALAPTQSEAPFAIAQVILLVAFIVLGRRAVINFDPERHDGLRPSGAMGV